MASKLSLAKRRMIAYAKRVGRTPIERDRRGNGLFVFDNRLVSHVFDARDRALLDAACILLEHGVKTMWEESHA